MRISTAGMYQQSLQSILQRQSDLQRTQEQMSTGQRFTHAGDDPAAATAAQGLDHALASLDQHERSAGHLERRLNLQETALSDAGDQLLRVRDLVVKANNATMSAEDRELVAIEIRNIREELVSIANRGDGAGRALFAGTRDGVVPFEDAGGSVQYLGNDGRNEVEIAPGQTLDDTDSGNALFMRVPTGDGGRRDIFATLDGIVATLEAPEGTPAADARTDTLGTALSDLSSAQEHLLAARAGTGSRLQSLDNATDSREATALALKSTLSDLRDVDYAEAATRFSMQLTALEAAQAVTLRIQGLSLFNKL